MVRCQSYDRNTACCKGPRQKLYLVMRGCPSFALKEPQLTQVASFSPLTFLLPKVCLSCAVLFQGAKKATLSSGFIPENHSFSQIQYFVTLLIKQPIVPLSLFIPGYWYIVHSKPHFPSRESTTARFSCHSEADRLRAHHGSQ